MKKIFIAFLTVTMLSASLAYVILFEGKLKNFEVWWDDKTRHSATIPFSPYKKYRKDSALLYFKGANSIAFEDRHLFWKGSHAIAKPEPTQKNKLINVIITTGGFGYSKKVRAYVTGAGGEQFELGPVLVEDGKIKKVSIKKSGLWQETPTAYYGKDRYPFSGTIEKKFSNNQIIEETQYLLGKIHGNVNRYSEKGIPVHSKEYTNGKKHGTHIFWFTKPIDPDAYTPTSNNGEKYTSLWMEINEKAKDKFRDKYATPESNEWVVQNYKLSGGDFEVELLEHWYENQKHGLFEGFDRFGNKTFKDEYRHGLRIKHKIFDKTK